MLWIVKYRSTGRELNVPVGNIKRGNESCNFQSLRQGHPDWAGLQLLKFMYQAFILGLNE